MECIPRRLRGDLESSFLVLFSKLFASGITDLLFEFHAFVILLVFACFVSLYSASSIAIHIQKPHVYEVLMWTTACHSPQTSDATCVISGNRHLSVIACRQRVSAADMRKAVPHVITLNSTHDAVIHVNASLSNGCILSNKDEMTS
jgi:hypothetical protein